MEIYLNIRHFDFLANVRTLKFGSELRYGIRSPNVRTPVDIPRIYREIPDSFQGDFDFLSKNGTFI